MTGGAREGWRLRGFDLPLHRPRVMGILNVTPDSFSDGGRFRGAEPALARARQMFDEGVDVIDVGGESTRPGASPVSAEEELARVLPVIRAIRAELEGVHVSIDTRHASVARAALDEGADIVNDVSALGDPEMARVVADSGAGLVLMHMRGTPATMQRLAVYRDVAAEVTSELAARLKLALDAGIDPACIVLDPGIGFAKDLHHNLELIARLDVLAELGYPIVLGASRKTFIGKLLYDVPARERDAGTVGACVAGLARGARIFRVHDVRPVRHALDVAQAIFDVTDPAGEW